ncbi:hypothetical protein B6U81_03780 [Thermoplasmatales archaeon ex4484_30]|nr:MAG: hypothetical protein B6U81_03780 [Thermoplasmatales archaeon ex4484_30]
MERRIKYVLAVALTFLLIFNIPLVATSSISYSIYFTPKDRVDQCMVDLINHANSSIYAAFYDIGLDNVVDALINAYVRGLDVRVVTDDKEGNTSQYQQLKMYGIVKTDHKSSSMHNKFIIVDNRTVWTGSYNPTPNCNTGYNNVIVINSTKLVADYLTEFKEMWGTRCLIKPGGSIRVHTGCGNDNSTDVYWQRGKPVWNNKDTGGDTAFLRDNKGNLVGRYTTNQSQTNFTNTSYTVTISNAEFDTLHHPEKDYLNEEWVEITNYGNTTVDMTDWTLSDEANHVYYFSSGKFGRYSPRNTPYPDFVTNGIGMEVYFAPEDNVSSEIIKEIEAANHTIYFETFVFTHHEIEQAIIEKNKSGVNAKGIFEKNMKYHSNSTFQNMSSNGINVTWDRSPEIMHNKVFIIDNKTVITGSFNPSKNADTKNDENVIIIHNENIAREYIDEFYRILGRQPGENNSSTHIVINEVELNPPGDDRLSTVMEWVEIYNPTSNAVNLTGWTLSTTHGETVTVTLYGTINEKGYHVYERSRWLDNEDESLILRNAYGNEIDRTPILSDLDNDNFSWQRYLNGIDTNLSSDWKFRFSTKGYSNGGMHYLPIANFSWTPSNPTVLGTIQFNDLSYDPDPDGSIVNWTWNFGDGDISYETNPSHQYADDGIYDVTLTVKDNDGATSSITKQINISKGNSPPNKPSQPFPANSSINVSVNSILSWVCNDPDGDDLTYDVYFGTSSPPTKVEDNITSTNYNPSLQYSTIYYWRIVAWDEHGAKNESMLWHFTTMAVPQYTLTITIDPSNAGSITLNPSGGVYDKGTVVTITAHANSGYEFSHWSGDSSGTNPTIQITMDSDKSVTAHFSETPQNQPPTVTITSPLNNSTVSGIVNIQGTASDDGTVQRVEIKIDSGLWMTATGTTSWSYSWNTTLVSNGNHTIYARSYDGTNYSSIVSVAIIVNNILPNHKPNVDIIFPLDGAVVKGIITIHGTASDEDGNESIVKVEIKIGDGNWKVVSGTTSWNYSWDSTSVENVDYAIQARAYDGQEYSSIDSIIVKVNNKKEGGGIPGFELIALFVALAAILLCKRKQR